MIEICKDVSPADIAVIAPDLTDKRADYLNDRLRAGSVFLARENGQPAGFLIYCVWWGDMAFIELIKVGTEYRRNGVGTALLAAAMAEIKDKGFKNLLSSTETGNPMGLQFHEKQGFRKLNTLALPHADELFFIKAL